MSAVHTPYPVGGMGGGGWRQLTIQTAEMDECCLVILLSIYKMIVVPVILCVKNNVTYFPLCTTGRIKHDEHPSRKGCILHNGPYA